ERELLEVLLAEVGTVGTNQVQQFGHDGEHAGEVPRSAGALQLGRERAWLDGDLRLTAAVDLGDGRGPDNVHPGLFAAGQVRVERSRVAAQVVVRAELARVDED